MPLARPRLSVATWVALSSAWTVLAMAKRAGSSDALATSRPAAMRRVLSAMPWARSRNPPNVDGDAVTRDMEKPDMAAANSERLTIRQVAGRGSRVIGWSSPPVLSSALTLVRNAEGRKRKHDHGQ